MYLNINKIKAIQARAVGTKVDSSIIEHIMRDIENIANKGGSEIKINYKDYNINTDKIPYVCHWARICGFIIAAYSECMYIKW